MDSPKPEIWKRKLQFIRSFAKEDRVITWAESQINILNKLPPKETLYLEAVETAQKLFRRGPLDEELWKRFEQLYWSELPLANESRAMESALVRFRQALLEAQIGNDDKEWGDVNQALLTLSRVVSNEVTTKAMQPTVENGS
ncbi:MAG: hypothetical protein C9356_09265 [Oleiphilus sp.]|nr:MAG: hypothetical protein C9356_09265 [Oleiphilus sp.]